MSPSIISKDMPDHKLSKFTEHVSCTYDTVLTTEVCRGFYVFCGQCLQYGEHTKGARSVHNAASVGDIWIFALQAPLRVM
jgi:hypothetical protein